MQSPFDLLPNVADNKLPFEPYPGATSVIGLVFQNTDTTYKFFWFLSVLHKANAAPFRTDLQLEIKEHLRGQPLGQPFTYDLFDALRLSKFGRRRHWFSESSGPPNCCWAGE